MWVRKRKLLSPSIYLLSQSCKGTRWWMYLSRQCRCCAAFNDVTLLHHHALLCLWVANCSVLGGTSCKCSDNRICDILVFIVLTRISLLCLKLFWCRPNIPVFFALQTVHLVTLLGGHVLFWKILDWAVEPDQLLYFSERPGWLDFTQKRSEAIGVIYARGHCRQVVAVRWLTLSQAIMMYWTK